MTESQEEYHQYLQTQHWKMVALEVKRRAGHRCQVCNSSYRLNAHHRTYANKGREMENLGDMTCLCNDCHDLYHKHGVIRYARIKKEPRHRGKAELVVTAHPNPALKTIDQYPDKVLLTATNYKGLRSIKEAYHWMKSIGLQPFKRGWNKRAIGQMVPRAWMKPKWRHRP